MSLAELAAQNGLHRVGARPRFWAYLKQTWDRRDFIFTMAEYRLRATVEENRLGVAWLVLQPLINAAIYGLIFGALQGNARGDDYPAHVVIGVFLFQFFSQSLSRGAKSITGNQSLVQSLAFPRMTLPLAEVIENLLALMPSMGLLVILLLCVAAVFLFRSFNRQLKKVPASFEADPPAEGPSPSQARVPAVEEPADAAPASDESPPGRTAPGG